MEEKVYCRYEAEHSQRQGHHVPSRHDPEPCEERGDGKKREGGVQQPGAAARRHKRKGVTKIFGLYREG